VSKIVSLVTLSHKIMIKERITMCKNTTEI